MKKLIIALLLAISLLHAAANRPATLDEAISLLEYTVDHSADYQCAAPMRILASDSTRRSLEHARLLFAEGDSAMAMAELSEYYDTLSITHPLFAETASLVACYYDSRPGRADDALYHRILAAISDIQTGSCAALPVIVPLLERERSTGYVTVIILAAALVLALAAVAMLVYRIAACRRKMVSDAEIEKADDFSLKDAYIHRMLDLSYEYVDRLEEFNRMAARKIKAKQVDDLYEQIQTGKLLRDQTAKFLEVFDSTFLSIFPRFADEVNVLLRPDGQLAQPSPDKLSTELRILAFMRLGIDDASRVAKFLNLSVNTVYTYRNKMKNRASNRENFEENIKNHVENTQ